VCNTEALSVSFGGTYSPDRDQETNTMEAGQTTDAAVTDRSVPLPAGAKFICGVQNVEDLIQVPGTKWVIGIGFNWDPTSQNYLHLFDAENETGA
jgi:ribulose 1,5-bisphosphate synthetase/thiazole synthase